MESKYKPTSMPVKVRLGNDRQDKENGVDNQANSGDTREEETDNLKRRTGQMEREDEKVLQEEEVNPWSYRERHEIRRMFSTSMR